MKTKNILSVSGGKDSTAMLLLAIEKGVEFTSVFADTGNEHEITYEYISYLQNNLGLKIERVKADFTADIERKRIYIAEKWRGKGVPEFRVARALELLRPTGIPYLDLCMLKGRFPGRKSQFCTEGLKTAPIFDQVFFPLMEKGHRVFSWQGVRSEESAARANLGKIEKLGGGLLIFRPLLKWSAADVFAQHRRHGIKPNPLYKLGFNRVGCMPCINSRKSDVREMARRFPPEVERIAEWEQLVAEVSKRGLATFFPAKTIPGKKDTRAHIQAVAHWAQTRRGGRIRDLVMMAEDLEPPACSSTYGLCE